MNKKKKSRISKAYVGTGPIISDKVGNYENDPFFVKKAEDAKAFLRKAGLPKQFQRKIKLYD